MTGTGLDWISGGSKSRGSDECGGVGPDRCTGGVKLRVKDEWRTNGPAISK